MPLSAVKNDTVLDNSVDHQTAENTPREGTQLAPRVVENITNTAYALRCVSNARTIILHDALVILELITDFIICSLAILVLYLDFAASSAVIKKIHSYLGILWMLNFASMSLLTRGLDYIFESSSIILNCINLWVTYFVFFNKMASWQSRHLNMDISIGALIGYTVGMCLCPLIFIEITWIHWSILLMLWLIDIHMYMFLNYLSIIASARVSFSEALFMRKLERIEKAIKVAIEKATKATYKKTISDGLVGIEPNPGWDNHKCWDFEKKVRQSMCRKPKRLSKAPIRVKEITSTVQITKVKSEKHFYNKYRKASVVKTEVEVDFQEFRAWEERNKYKPTKGIPLRKHYFDSFDEEWDSFEQYSDLRTVKQFFESKRLSKCNRKIVFKKDEGNPGWVTLTVPHMNTPEYKEEPYTSEEDESCHPLPTLLPEVHPPNTISESLNILLRDAERASLLWRWRTEHSIEYKEVLLQLMVRQMQRHYRRERFAYAMQQLQNWTPLIENTITTPETECNESSDWKLYSGYMSDTSSIYTPPPSPHPPNPFYHYTLPEDLDPFKHSWVDKKGTKHAPHLWIVNNNGCSLATRYEYRVITEHVLIRDPNELHIYKFEPQRFREIRNAFDDPRIQPFLWISDIVKFQNFFSLFESLDLPEPPLPPPYTFPLQLKWYNIFCKMTLDSLAKKYDFTIPKTYTLESLFYWMKIVEFSKFSETLNCYLDSKKYTIDERVKEIKEILKQVSDAVPHMEEPKLAESFLERWIPKVPSPTIKTGFDSSTQEWGANQVSSLLGGLAEVSDAFKEGVSNMKLDVKIPFLETMWKSISDKITNRATLRIVVLVFYAQISILSRYYELSDWSRNLITICDFLAVFLFMGDTAYSYFIEVKNSCEIHVEPVERVTEASEHISEAFLSVLLGFTYYSVYAKTASQDMLSTFMRSVGNFDKYKNGLSSIFDYLVDLIFKFIRWIGDKTNSTYLKGAGLGSGESVDLHKRVLELREHITKGLRLTTQSAGIAKALERDIRLKIAVAASEKRSAECQSLQQLLHTVVAIVNDHSAQCDEEEHWEGAMFLIGGAAGSGKSIQTMYVTDELAVDALSPHEFRMYCRRRADFVCNWICEQEFKDNYTGQPFGVIDDLGQMTETMNSETSEAMDIIRLINNHEYIVNKAHLSGKCNQRAKIKIMVSSTNMKTLFRKFPKLRCQAALGRRIYFFHQAPSDEWCENPREKDFFLRRWDKKKLDEFPEVDMNKCIFVRVDPMSTDDKVTLLSDVLTFAEYKELLHKLYKEKERKGKSLNQFHAEHREELLSGVDPDLGITYSTIDYLYDNHLVTFGASLSNIWDAYCIYVLDPLFIKMEKLVLQIQENAMQIATWTAIAAALAAVAIGYRCMRSTLTVEEHSGKDKTKKSAVKKPIHVLSAKVSAPVSVEHSARFNESHLQLMRTLMCKSVYYIDICQAIPAKDSPDSMTIYNVLSPNCMKFTFLAGTVGVICKHFSDYCNSYSDKLTNIYCRFVSVGRDYSFGVSWEDIKDEFYRVEECEEDEAYLYIPFRKVHPHKHIFHFMLDSSEDSSKNFSGALLQTTKDITSHLSEADAKKESLSTCDYVPIPITIRPVPLAWKQEITDGPCVGKLGYQYGRYWGTDLIMYEHQMYKGTCGTPIIKCDSSDGVAKLVGLHVAGSASSASFGFRLKKEVAMKVYELICDLKKTEYLIEAQEPLPAVEHCGIPRSVVPECIVSAKMPSLVSEKRKSKVYKQVCEVLKVPALLKAKVNEGEVINPYLKVRKKYNISMPPLNSKLLDWCADLVQDRIAASIENHEGLELPRLLSFEECVKGYGNLGPIPRGTSAGYPYNKTCKKKYDLFGRDGEFDFSSKQCQELHKEFDEACVLLESGQRPATFFADFLKDELRDISKVKEGKTRLISACNVLELLLVRRYFGHWISMLIQGKIANGCAIGVNPMSSDWSVIARNLLRFNKLVAGDQGGWDGKTRYECFHTTRERVVERHYINSTPGERRARYVLVVMMGNSRHVKAEPDFSLSEDGRIMMSSNQFVYEWYMSMSSGHPLTTPFNCVHNEMETHYAICVVKLDGDHLGYTLDQEYKLDYYCQRYNCFIIVFGDDIVASFGPGMEDCTQRVLTRAFASMGREFTDELKGDAQHDFRTLLEVLFLKRRFEYIHGEWRAPLELESIEQPMNWTNRGCDDSDFVNFLEECVYEYSYHSEKLWAEKRPLINSLIMTVFGRVPSTPNNYLDTLQRAKCLERYHF